MQQPNTNSIVAHKQSIRNALNGPSNNKTIPEPQDDEDIGFTVSEGDDDDDDDGPNLSDSSTHSNAIVLSDHDDDLDLKNIYDLDMNLDMNLDLDSDVDLDIHDDLARALQEDAGDDLDDLDADELDDSMIEQEEERAIQEQYTAKPTANSSTKYRQSSDSDRSHTRTRANPLTPAYTSGQNNSLNNSAGNDADGDADTENESFKDAANTSETARSETENENENDVVNDFNELSGVGLGLGLEDEPVESSSDAFSEGSAWGNDLFDDNVNAPKRAAPPHKQTSSFYDEEDDSEGDDSYLWQYFFSSGGDTDEDSDIFDVAENKNVETNPQELNSSDEEVPVRDLRGIPATHLPSGESTDEDDGVPPERKRRRAKGTKALEVLGSNSFTTRPPLLGTWEIDGDKNIGIIDGRTTRTLSPPQEAFHESDDENELNNADADADADANANANADGTVNNEGFENEDGEHGLIENGNKSRSKSFRNKSPSFSSGKRSRRRSAIKHTGIDGTGLSDFDDNDDDNDDDDTFFELPESLDVNDFENDDMSVFIEDNDHPQPQQPEQHPPLKRSGSNLDIGDFINMSSDSEDQLNLPDNEESVVHKQSPAISPYLYRGRLQSRNNTASASAFNALRNRGSPFVSNLAYYSNEDNMSPAIKRSRRRPRSAMTGNGGVHMSPMKRRKRRSFHGVDPVPEERDQDFIGELIEIGAISPIFDVNT